MSTSLAKQLSRLQQRPEHDAKLCHSFLFTDSDAKQFSREQVLELALSGLQTVMTLDNRVHRDAAFLFDRQFVRRERATLTDPVQQEVNQHVEHLLTLLSPHLLLTAAQQMLEYLVRVWEVHTYNVSAVLRAFIPYHDHAIFARILLLLDLRDSGFDGLEKNQLEGAPLITPVLIRLCGDSRKALRTVCSAALEAVRCRVVNHASFAVFISVCSALSAHPDGEALFRTVLPMLHDMICGASSSSTWSSSQRDDDEALEAGADDAVAVGGAEAIAVWRHNRDIAVREGQSAALIVLCAWCQVAQLSTRSLAALLKPWLLTVHHHNAPERQGGAHNDQGDEVAAVDNSGRSAFLSGARVTDTLRVLALIFRTQMRALEDPAFSPVVQMVMSLPWRSWAAHVPAGCAPMFSALLRFVCDQSLSTCEAAQSVSERMVTFLAAAAEVLPLRPCDITLIVATVAANRALHEAFCCGSANHDGAHRRDAQQLLLSNVFPALQRRFGVSFDAAIVSLLRGGGRRNAEVVEQFMATFLAGNLSGTAMLLSVPSNQQGGRASSGGGVMRLPLTICLMHHLPEVRCLAFRECVARSAVANLTTAHGATTSEIPPYVALLDVLAHATRFECDLATVGADVVAAAGAWLRVLSKSIALSTASEPDVVGSKSAADSPSHNPAAADPFLRWAATASAALLDSLFAFAARAISEAPTHEYLELAGKAVRALLDCCDGSGTPLRSNKQHAAVTLQQGAVYAVSVLAETVLEQGTELENATLAAVAAEWSRLAHNAVARSSPSVSSQQQQQQSPPAGSSAKKGTRKPSSASQQQQPSSEEAIDIINVATTQSPSTLRTFLNVLPLDRLPRVLEQVLRMAGGQDGSRVCRRELLWITEHAVAMLSPRGPAAAAAAASVGGTSGLEEATDAAPRLALARISAFFDESQAGSYPSRARALALQRLAQAKVNGTAPSRGTAASQQSDWRNDETVQQLRSVVADITARYLSSASDTPLCASAVDTAKVLLQLLQTLGGSVPPAPLTLRSCSAFCAASLLAASDSRDLEKQQVFTWARASLSAVLAPVKLGGDGDSQQSTMSVDQAMIVLQLVLSMLSASASAAGAGASASASGLREAFLPKLQNEVVLCGASSTSRGKGTTTASMFRVAIGVLVDAKVLTLTGCNSLLEVFDPRGAARGGSTITLDAAGVVSSFLRTTSPFLRIALFQTFFPALLPSPSGTTSSSARRLEVLQLALSSAAVVIAEKVTATTTPSEAAQWEMDEVQFFRHALTLVDRDVALTAAASSSTLDSADAAKSAAQDPVKTLLLLALDHPALLCRDSESVKTAPQQQQQQQHNGENQNTTIVPMYRDALDALARVFVSEQDLDAGAENDDDVVVFRPTKQQTRNAQAPAPSSSTQNKEVLAKWGRETTWARLLKLWDLHGRDAANFVASTSAGHSVFLLPWLDSVIGNPQALVPRDARDAARCIQSVEFVSEVLDCQFAPSAAENSWKPSVQQHAALPIRASAVLAFAGTLSGVVKTERLSHSAVPLSSCLLLPCVKLLTVVARYVPSLRYDAEHEQERGGTKALPTPKHVSSPQAALETLLEVLPLGTLGSLALDALGACAAADDRGDETRPKLPPAAAVFAAVLGYVRVMCAAVQQNARTHHSNLPNVALRHALELTTAVVSVNDSTSSGSTNSSSSSAAASATSLSIQSCNFVMGVLSAVAPIVGASSNGGGEDDESGTRSVSSNAAAGDVAGPSRNHLLHVVVLALLFRLESVEHSEALHFRSAVDCCREAMVSFDIDSQMICLTGLLDVLLCPEDPAKGYTNDATIRALAKKMLKPNKIINRQETILRLVTAVLKDDGFLQPFIDSQQRGRLRRKTAATGGAELQQDNNDEGQGERSGSGSTLDTNCMRLLVAALAAFAQYHELNEATAGSADDEGDAEEDGAGRDEDDGNESRTADGSPKRSKLFSDDKTYTMLLELLSGNALACILAGINEPTFVECQRRLLGDHRVALQQKGLETLLDRLRQSLPAAAEQTMTEAEAEQRRRDLRDPKRKLTAMELLVLKARPLTTKRTLTLLPALDTIFTAAIRFVSGRVSQLKPSKRDDHGNNSSHAGGCERGGGEEEGAAPLSLASAETPSTQQTRRTMMHVAQVAVSCVEELVRIVASGGSVVAEAVLAQGPQLGESDAVPVHKQFGAKAKSSEVKHFVGVLLQSMSWLQATKTSVAAASQRANSPTAFFASTDSLALLGSMTTALASIVQACGTVFFLDMSNDILQALSRVGLYSIRGVPAELQASAAARVQRESCLNSIIRCLPCTWIMSHPYVPSFLSVATHLHNTDDDGAGGVLSKELLRLVQNVLEPRVVVEACCSVLAGDKQPLFHPATHSTHALFGCLQELLGRLTKSDLSHMPFLMNSDSVVALDTRGTDASSNLWISALNGLAQMPQLCSADTMNAVFDAYLTFLMKFKAAQCQSLFSTIVSWAFRTSAAGGPSKGNHSEGGGNNTDDDAAVTSRRDIHRAFVFQSLYHRVLDKLQSVAEFSFELATPPLVSLMTLWAGGSQDNQDEHGGSGHLAPRKVAGDAKITVTLELVFDNVRLMSDAMLPLPDEPIASRQTPYFAQPAVFNSLMPVLVQQLANVRYLSDSNVSYDQRVRRSLVPALRSYCKALQSSKLWSALQRELLKQLRSPNHHVRRAVLSVFRVVYEDGGDEMAAMIMSEMLPAVVEATEDSHADVVEEARLLCNELSTITGRDVLYAMS